LQLTNRMAVGGISLGFGAIYPFLGDKFTPFLENLALTSPTLFLIKLSIALPFAYHYANGIRHLTWDTGRMFKIKQIIGTGNIMMGTTALLTLFFMCL